MGAVYAAVHTVTGREVALKVVHRCSDKTRARLVREARAASAVGHPNLVDVYDVDEHDGQPFLVMERLHGVPLSARIDGAAMEASDAVRLLEPALHAIDAGHVAGVVHRDLKPDNLFVCRDDTVKVLDFGISKLLFDAGAPLTAEGMIVGTPIYMAPEQLAGRPVDGRADQYALALVLYQMVEGRAPHPEQELVGLPELLAAKIASPPRFQRQHPRAFTRAIRRALRPRPEERFDTVAAFAEALRRAVEPTGRSNGGAHPLRHHAVAPTLAGLAAAAVVGVSLMGAPLPARWAPLDSAADAMPLRADLRPVLRVRPVERLREPAPAAARTTARRTVVAAPPSASPPPSPAAREAVEDPIPETMTLRSGVLSLEDF